MITLKAVIQGFFLIIVIHFRYAWGIPVGGLISSKAAGCMSAVLVEGGSFVGVPRVFHLFHFLLCERLFFWGTVLGACFNIWKIFRSTNLTFKILDFRSIWGKLESTA